MNRIDKLLAQFKLGTGRNITLIYRDGSRKEMTGYEAVIEVSLDDCGGVVGVETDNAALRSLVESFVRPVTDEEYQHRVAMLYEEDFSDLPEIQ